MAEEETEQPFGMEGQPSGTWSGESNPCGESEDDRKETTKLRELLFEDFNMFLLNNILMSVQFFENYERDVSELRQRRLEETTVDSNQFAVFQADSIHRLVASKVTFQRISDDAKKSPSEHLHPTRTYVTYKNVDLVRTSSFNRRPTAYDAAKYKLTIQSCEDEKEVAGYVNLIDTESQDRAEPGPATWIHHPDDEEDASIADTARRRILSGALLQRNDNFYVLDPLRRSKPYPVRTYRTRERIIIACSIPRSCFRENDTQTGLNMKRSAAILLAKQQKQRRCMLMSAAFKRHFAEVFISHLSARIQFDKVNWDGVTFHHDRLRIPRNAAHHHVIPVLEVRYWPQEATQFPDNEINRKDWIEWPTKAMQRTIRNWGCSLLPSGYQETSEQAVDYTLEWKFEFPKAEEYLSTHLMHTHVRCYLFALTLYKTYIETNSTTSVHFGPSHLSNLLFFMVRKNFEAWPEYRQGETLAKFLRNLHTTLQRKGMKSFFLHKRNLLADAPQRVLHRAQTLVMRILRNLVPYTLKALMNLKHRDDFYPVIDYLKLYNILTVDNLKEYLYPTPPPKTRKGRKLAPTPTVRVRTAVDEEEILQPRNTPQVREEVLRFFISHFIDVAYHCRRYEAFDSSMLYLTHARRLTTILSEEYVSRTEISELTDRILKAMSDSRRGHIPKGLAPLSAGDRPLGDATNRGGRTVMRETLPPPKRPNQIGAGGENQAFIVRL